MSSIDTTEWYGVPLNLIEAWNEVFQKSRETLNLSSPCPVCGATTLHRWYQIGRPIDKIVEGQRYVARGGLWEWCSTCRAYEHAQALVPEWWSSSLEVNEADLTAEPEAIEKGAVQFFI
jgi:hypothetical protein